MSAQCLAEQAQQAMVEGQYQQARDCLMRITESAAQAVVIKMLLLVAEHELAHGLPSAAEFVPLRCVDERWPSRWVEPHVKCGVEEKPCSGLSPKDESDKSRFACSHETPWSDLCAHPCVSPYLKRKSESP